MAILRLRLLERSYLHATVHPPKQWGRGVFLVAARLMAKMVGGETMGEGVPSGAHFCNRAMSLMKKVA